MDHVEGNFAPPERRANQANVSNTTARGSAALRRMMRELKLVQCDPSWGVSAAPVSDEDLFTWHCNVAGRPPAGGDPVVLHIELTFPPDYPSRPPRVEILGSTVRHPNVFSTFICLDMLEGGEWAADEEKRRPYCGWSSAYSILAILRQLQTFFFEGDGSQWWDCAFCTLRNPIKLRRCDACEQSRGAVNELTIEVTHHADFRCRCGHAHNSTEVWPPFPDSTNCDDAPAVVPLPDHPDDACAICLGRLDEATLEGPLKGALGARPLAQLLDSNGSDLCRHWFHLPCIQQLQTKDCPLCRREFAEIVVRKQDALSMPTLEREMSISSASSNHCLWGSARARMTRLAEWPLRIVVNIMAFMRRPERATLASAIPVWREAASAPDFWEAQELQCFHEKVGPHEDTIGIGVHAEGTRKLSKLTAHFDAVSLTAWQGGLRQAAWKEPMTHWLPLFINRDHSANAASIMRDCLALLSDCAPTGEDSHLPSQVFEILSLAGGPTEAAPPEAVNAVIVLPEMMHQLLKQVLDGDRHASAKVLKGYFVLHRLFLHFCDEWPAIREAADVAIRTFAESPDNRTKTATPWIAYILQLLTVSNVGWDDVKTHFVEEVLARNVQFTRASFPNYRPVDPDAADDTSLTTVDNPFSEWLLFEDEHGSDIAGTVGAREIAPGVWCGRPTGWSCLAGAFRPSHTRHAFSVRVGNLPAGAVLRIGWSSLDACTPFHGWFYYASSDSFGNGGWFSCGPSSWTHYGRSFKEDDLLTACFDRGVVSFRLNQDNLGNATYTAGINTHIRPIVALKRGAEVKLMPSDFKEEDAFATPEQLRNMAWEARLNRRGNTLVLFQVFFLSLVRPRGEGTLDWDALKNEYDRRLGFPSPEMSSALMQQFGEVHRVVAMRGNEGWPLYFEMLGFPRPSDLELDRMLFKAYQRATRLGYKMPGRRDHA